MKKLIPAVAGFALLLASASASGDSKKGAQLTNIDQQGGSQQGSVGGSGTMGSGAQGSQMGEGSPHGQMGQTGQMGQMTGGQQLQGTVRNYDKKRNQLTIELPLSPNATVMKNGQMARTDDIKKGEEVRASYDPTTGSIVSVEIQPKGMQQQPGQGGTGSPTTPNEGTSGSNY